MNLRASSSIALLTMFWSVFALAKTLPDALSPDDSIGFAQVLVNEEFAIDFNGELRVFAGDKYVKAEIEKAELDLKNLAEQMGFSNSRVEALVYRMGAKKWGVQFDVHLGEPVVIKSLSFLGRTRLLPLDLKDILRVSSGDRFDKKRIARGLLRVQEWLFKRNFWAAKAQIADVKFSDGGLGADVSIEIDAGPKYGISVRGDTFFSAQEIKNRVLEKVQKAGVNERSVDQIRYQLQSAYRRVGFNNVEVQIEDNERRSRDVKSEINHYLDVDITEGMQVLLEGIQIKGASFFSNGDLETKTRAFLQSRIEMPSILGPIDHSEVDGLIVSQKSTQDRGDQVQIFGNNDAPLGKWLPYDEKLLTLAKDNIREMYNNAGFLDANVQGPKLLALRQGRWAKVSFTVTEGKQFLVGEVKLVSPWPMELSSWVPEPAIVSGAPLNGRQVELLRAQIEQSLWNRGYPLARVVSEVVSEGDKNRIGVLYRVETGAFVKIAEINIMGNNVTRREVVLNRLKLKVGDEFSLEKLAESRTRLLQSDLFSKVDIFLDKEDNESEPRRLVVDLQERPRTTVELGLGMSLEQGPRIIGSLQYRNLFGLGIGLKTRAQLNYPALFYRMPFFYSPQMVEALEHRFENEEPWARPLLYTEGKLLLGLDFPKIHWLPFEADASLDLTGTREIRPAFTLNKVGLQLSALGRVTSWLHLTPQLEVEYANFNCPVGYTIGFGCGDRSTGSTRRLDAGAVNQFTVRLLSAIDRRDSPIRPGQGYSFELNGDIGLGQANLFGPDRSPDQRPIHYGKVVGALNLYIPLARRLVFSVSAKAGSILNFSADGFVPLFKRFYLGGTNTIRGYAEDQILPADDDNWPADHRSPKDPGKASLSLGGNFFVLTRGEIRFPLAGDLEGGVFMDVGELLKDVNNFSFSSIAIGTGFGIRYQTPIGPLLFDLGLRIFDGDRVFSPGFWNLFGIHFSIGYS